MSWLRLVWGDKIYLRTMSHALVRFGYGVRGNYVYHYSGKAVLPSILQMNEYYESHQDDTIKEYWRRVSSWPLLWGYRQWVIFVSIQKHNTPQPRKKAWTPLHNDKSVWKATGPTLLSLTKWPAIAMVGMGVKLEKCKIEGWWAHNLIFSSRVGRGDGQLSFLRQGEPQFKN